MARNTIKMLRRRIVVIALAALVVALTAIFGIVNIWNRMLITERADSIIDVLSENDGSFPKDWGDEETYDEDVLEATAETPYETRYLVAEFDEDENITNLNLEHLANLDRTEAETAARMILEGDDEEGYLDRYRFRVITNSDGTGMLIAVDCFQQLDSAENLMNISVAVSGATVLVTFAIIVPLSKRVAEPFIENLERQRRFVTDASHELRTPIAIIAANTDLIEAINGESSWTRSTRTQTARLDKLTGELIELARTDEPTAHSLLIPLDLVSVVEREAEDFAPLADASGKILDVRCDEHAMVRGAPEELERLINVLLDNAVKYCDDGGCVRVRVSEHLGEVRLSVSNPCVSLSSEDTKRLFDRFYRADTSRARSTGGYGIGLSIAQGIVARHSGKISAKKVGDDLEIHVTFPRA